MKKLGLLVMLFAATGAQATSIKEFWQTRPADSPRFQTSKSSLALEMCLGMDMSELAGPPIVFHGEAEVVLTSLQGANGNPTLGVRITDHGASREVIVGALQTGGWTNKITAAVQRCI
jgi:hypothetical protein